MISGCGQEDRVFSILYVVSYNKLEQLHMQVLYIKLSFDHFFVQSIQKLKKRPNDNLITLECVIALVYYN